MGKRGGQRRGREREGMKERERDRARQREIYFRFPPTGAICRYILFLIIPGSDFNSRIIYGSHGSGARRKYFRPGSYFQQ